MPFGFHRHHHHRHPPRGGMMPFVAGAAIGGMVVASNRRCRPRPPPCYGRPGYYYNYPHVVYVTAPVHRSQQPNYPTVIVQQPGGGHEITAQYLIDVPSDVYAGEKFRVQVDGYEYLITAPDQIGGQGGRITLAIRGGNPPRTAPAQPPIAHVVGQQQPLQQQYQLPAEPSHAPSAPPAETVFATATVIQQQPPPQQQQQYSSNANEQLAQSQPSWSSNPLSGPGAVPVYPSQPPQSAVVGQTPQQYQAQQYQAQQYQAQQYQASQQPITATAIPIGTYENQTSFAPGQVLSTSQVPCSAGGGDVKQCPLCTFDNPMTARQCEMCDTQFN